MSTANYMHLNSNRRTINFWQSMQGSQHQNLKIVRFYDPVVMLRGLSLVSAKSTTRKTSLAQDFERRTQRRITLFNFPRLD